MKLLKTFFYSFKKSLFEPKYYKDVAKVKFWFSFKYLLCLLFIFVIFKSVVLGGQYLKSRPQIQPGVNKLFTYAENFYPKDLELKIRNNQLSTNVNEPYIFDPDLGEGQINQRHLLIIDTKGSIEDYPNYNTYVLATKNALVYPSKSANSRIEQTAVLYFRDLKQNLTLNKKIYDNFLNIIKPFTYKVLFFADNIFLAFIFLFLIFGTLFWAGWIMFGLLFLTFFVWIVSLIFKRQYGYGSLYKMGLHAVTWPLFINEVFRYILPIPRFYSLIFLVWMLVVLFSIEKKTVLGSSIKKRG